MSRARVAVCGVRETHANCRHIAHATCTARRARTRTRDRTDDRTHASPVIGIARGGDGGVMAPRIAGDRVLNVAEKPSVAREISRVLSNGHARSREGVSRFNKVWEFPYVVQGRQVTMVFTSVIGHLSNFEFEPGVARWNDVDPKDLFHCRVTKTVANDKVDVANNIKRESRGCQSLILWLDCDREGENIAFEVLQTCREANARMVVLRARFSALSRADADRALNNLVVPNEFEAKAVDMRMELDLRLGAAFTRFNTLALQRAGVNLPVDDRGKSVVSYGPCQFPTLGFIVQRKWDIDAHVSEDFWAIKCSHERAGTTAQFEWRRGRLFDHGFANNLFDMCTRANIATVIDVDGQESKRWPPHPLNTLEMQKRLNRVLRISPEQIMKIAEDLYNDGFISYPRTETDKFPDNFDYDGTLADMAQHAQFGFYANGLINGRFRRPPGGGKDDKAHPPIYPTKLADDAAYAKMRSKNVNMSKVYEFVCRHFLATCSHPAVAMKTHVDIDVAGEAFRATGVMIRERNYLDIYGPGPPEGPRLAPTYDNWGNSTLPTYESGEQFTPVLNFHQGATRAPDYLSEVDLLSLMESHMIGTDATQAQHIEKVVGERGYARKVGDNRLTPTELGEALVLAYDRMGVADMWLPTKRAEMERDVDAAAHNRLNPAEGLQKHLDTMLDAYTRLDRAKNTLTSTVGSFMDGGQAAGGGANAPARGAPPARNAGDIVGDVRHCPGCGGTSKLYSTQGARNIPKFTVQCDVQHCAHRVTLPSCTRRGEVEHESCGQCRGQLCSFRFAEVFLPIGFQHMVRWTGCVFCSRDFAEFARACQNDEPAPRASPVRQAAPAAAARGGRGGRGGRGARGAGRATTAGRRRTRAERDAPAGGANASRPCYKCGEQGHWAANCPNGG